MAKVSIYNIQGECVACLCDELQEPATNSVSWDASAVSSGIYFCRLEIDGKPDYLQMMLIG
ncbi:MAG: T9SS type A sorting domain-containing protein [candidate division Zixibacteria bacterium]|nr:T9SS type A sorting domain-containing protein [candidate division Zixibacteria bacterium]